VHRFNEYGPEGLIDIKPPGRPSKLSEEQREAVLVLRFWHRLSTGWRQQTGHEA
jgi:transposase